jgi:hypothetical protein
VSASRCRRPRSTSLYACLERLFYGDSKRPDKASDGIVDGANENEKDVAMPVSSLCGNREVYFLPGRIVFSPLDGAGFASFSAEVR